MQSAVYVSLTPKLEMYDPTNVMFEGHGMKFYSQRRSLACMICVLFGVEGGGPTPIGIDTSLTPYPFI